MALLTPSEIAWLKGEKQVSKGYARFLRHSIHRKLAILADVELPLLSLSGFSVSIGTNVSVSSSALVAQPGRVERSVNREMREKSPRWDTRRITTLSDPRPRVYETLALPG
jgi:hypothetical protein